MSEAPKKIWMMENPQAWATRDDMFNTPYIRADIVDELVEALKLTLKSHGSAYMSDSTILRIKAALKKLEESHE